MYIVSIPKITDRELMKRYGRIKPLVEVDGVKYWLRDYNIKEIKEKAYLSQKI